MNVKAIHKIIFQDYLFQFETTVMKTKDILDQSYLHQLLDNFGIDLSNINDIIDGADFDPEVVNGFISGLGEATKLLESQLEQISEQQKRYEEKEREKMEQEAAKIAAAAQKNQEQAANLQKQPQQPQAIPTAVHDQVSQANWERYELLVRNKQDFAKGTFWTFNKEHFLLFQSNKGRLLPTWCNFVI